MEERRKDGQSKNDRSGKKINLARKAPSTVRAKRKQVITAKETTCRDCGCFANEERYFKNMKLNKCMNSPLTLYEIASEAVNGLPLPRAFDWSVEAVAEWISDEVGLPQYRDCFTKNQINGLRLLMLEDPSRLPDMNIQDFHHIRTITSSIRQNYSTELVEFSRSISLPPRKPLTHCTWFKSRTGPSWGVRRNWTRCDILRWMEIIMPEPIHLDHWDYVWYRKPDYPKVRYARPKLSKVTKDIPIYEPTKDLCKEYLVPRKFRILRDQTESKQMIWMEIQQSPKCEEKQENIATKERRLNNLMQKQIDLKGLSGKQLILARRRMPKPKFLP